MYLLKRTSSLYPVLLVSLICLLVYLPALKCGFINVDDPEYVLTNPLIKELTPANLLDIFSRSYLGWWMPLTWLSLAVDHHFWGLNPFGYHLTNILLHAVNAGIVVLIVARLGAMTCPSGDALTKDSYPWLPLVAAGLFFGIHPLRVESVAWIAERKDVLNGFFTFLSLLFYLQAYARSVNGEKGRGTYQILSLLCFACSLLSKSTSVVLPAILVVLDWALLGRLRDTSLRRLIVEKWPYWSAALLMTFLTFLFAAQSQHLVTYEAFPLSQRMAVSGNAIWEYLRLLLFPVGLSPFNVIPDPIPVAYAVKALLVAAALAAILFSALSAKIKAALLCFLLPLLPVLAFFQNGDQSYADRFTYLASLSPAVFMSLGLWCGAANLTMRRLAIALMVLFVLLYVAITCRQTGVWRTPETYWTRVVEIEPSAISYKERGRYYHSTGRYDAAAADFAAAIAIIPPALEPYAYNFYAFRGEALRMAGRYAEAVSDFTTAIGMRPHPLYFYHRGLALKSLGKMSEAGADFRQAGPDTGPLFWQD